MNNKKLFKFNTSSLLIEITDKKATNLEEFNNILKTITDSSIFYHVHHAFREYNFAPGQYSNDLARWIVEDLEFNELAEKISSISILDYTDINSLRNDITNIIDEYKSNPIYTKSVPAGREFYFLSAISVALPTKYEVQDLDEFVAALEKVGMRSLYYHFFDARLRLGRKTNDFSNWIRINSGNEKLARSIELLDPYFMSMDQLKNRIIELCKGQDRSIPIQKKLWAIFLKIREFYAKK